MTSNEFLRLLQCASIIAHDFAKNYVLDELPTDYLYTVTLNATSGNPNVKRFDSYSNDNGKKIEYITAKQVIELLYRKHKIPIWIDIAVESVYEYKTIFRLLCAGYYSDNETDYYYTSNGTGPFGIKSPILPPDFIEGEKFKLKVLP
ncbi:MAG: hypothetical protein U0Y10_06315 [Spirosomataceae bacterium]